MSLRRSEAALVVSLHPSRQLLALLLMIHGLALALLWPLSERLGLFVLLLIALLLLSLIQSARRYALLHGRSAVIEVIIKNNNDYVLVLGGGQRQRARLRRGSYVHPLLVILNFKLEGFPWYVNVPLLTDSADAETLRCLRVRLRTMRDGELEKLA